MPVLNDLTEEERAAFAEDGVTFTDDAPAAAEEPAPVVVEPAPAPAIITAKLTVPVARDVATGKFVAPPAALAPAAASLSAVDPVTGQPTRPPEGYVPHAALHAERQQKAEIARNYQVLQTRMNAMLAQQHPQPTQAAMPNIEDDPLGYFARMEQRIAAFEQQRIQEVQTRQIDNALDQDELTFASQVPDYPNASQHWVQSRAQELLAFNPPDVAKDMLSKEVRVIAQEAWKRGMPASQMIYQLAQARGYTPGQAAPAAAPAPIAPVVPVARPLTPQATIEAVRQGQAVSRSLSSGGAAGAVDLNAEAILNMSDEEFEAHMKLGSKHANRLFAEIGGV